MGNFSVDKTTLLAIIIPMVALLLVGYISYESTIQFIQKDAVDDRINSINQRLDNVISTVSDYLLPYNSVVKDLHSQLGNLEMMIADEPANQRVS